MGTAYPLSGLLFIRDFRLDAATKAVSVAEAVLRDAQATLIRRQEELAVWRKWCDEEIARRYQAIMGQCLTQDDLDRFKAGLSMLADEGLSKEEAVHEAAQALEVARGKVAAARQLWRDADHERQKILYHRDEWQKGYAKEQVRLEDLELEEFKPVLFTVEADAEG